MSSAGSEDDPDVIRTATEDAQIKAKIKQARNKRKRLEEDILVPGHSKRAKLEYRDSYRKLLNEAIDSAERRFNCDFSEPLLPSQIGASQWSVQEKETLFSAIEKLGLDDLPGISAAIASKSSLQIREYLLLLRSGLIEDQLHARKAQILHLTDFPAAAEISPECCMAEEQAARLLSTKVQDREFKIEESRHGNFALIDYTIASQLDAANEEDTSEADETDIASTTHTQHISDGGASRGATLDSSSEFDRPGELFHLSRWIELSTKVFMNAGPPREYDGWEAISSDGETPSVFYTAFDDFQRLTISITKRLVQACLFQAMSRLRQTDRLDSRRPAQVVRNNDVWTALETLQMPADARRFWRDTARRCGVRVFTTPESGTEKGQTRVYLSHDAVEHELDDSSGVTPSSESEGNLRAIKALPAYPVNYKPHRLDDGDEADDMNDSSSETTTQSQNEDDTELDNFDHASEDAYDPIDLPDRQALDATWTDGSRRRWTNRHIIEQAQEDHAETFDNYASAEEEKRLWSILADHLPRNQKVDVSGSSGEMPFTARKTVSELVDWRDWTPRLSEWEMLGYQVPQREFVETQRQNHTAKHTVEEKRAKEGAKSANDASTGSTYEGEQLSLSEAASVASDHSDDESQDIPRKITLPRRARKTVPLGMYANQSEGMASQEALSSGDSTFEASVGDDD